jgi:hypothetical protein
MAIQTLVSASWMSVFINVAVGQGRPAIHVRRAPRLCEKSEVQFGFRISVSISSGLKTNSAADATFHTACPESRHTANGVGERFKGAGGGGRKKYNPPDRRPAGPTDCHN